MGNALRFLWKPQTYTPSWSKSVKDPKDTEDSMPKLLRKYGAYCFEYALANDTRREKIPNIDKLKQDIIKEYGNVKEANGDFYKLLTMLRKVSLNDEEITSVINQDVNVTNFQNIRKKFEDIGKDNQRIFLDIATKKIRYILKYWVTTSRQSENEKSFIPDMTNVIKNISDLNTSVILDKGKLIDSNMVKISLSQTYQGLMKEIKNKYIPALIKNKSYSNDVQNYLIMCAQILEIITNSTLTVDGVMSALSAEGVFSKYKQDMYISIKDKEISIAQLIHLTEEIVNKRFDNIRQQLAQLLNGVLKDYTSSGYDDYDENITKQTLNKFIEKIMKNN